MSYLSRYHHGRMGRIFTVRAQLERWFDAEHAIAIAGNYSELAEDLRKSRDLWPGDPQFVREWFETEAKVGHDVAAFVQVTERWLENCGCSQSRFIHYGATSSDVVDTGWALATRRAQDLVDQLLRDLTRVLHDHQREQSGRPRIAYTHGQQAAITTAGTTIERWSYDLVRAKSRHASVLPLPGRIAGPVGDRPIIDARHEKHGLAAIGLYADQQGSQIVSRDRLVEWLQALSAVAVTCATIATGIRFALIEGIDGAMLQRANGEISSSSIPRKSAAMRPSPAPAERVCGLAVLIRHLVQAVDSVQIGWADHTLEHSSVERVVVPQVAELTAFVLEQTTDLLRRLFWSNSVPGNVDTQHSSFEAMHRMIDQGATRRDALRFARDGFTDYYNTKDKTDG